MRADTGVEVPVTAGCTAAQSKSNTCCQHWPGKAFSPSTLDERGASEEAKVRADKSQRFINHGGLGFMKRMKMRLQGRQLIHET